jgi:2-polyprenyl-3-methyl-5-hydroxy-6-metoxy-1,4-benzoquinol methylase
MQPMREELYSENFLRDKALPVMSLDWKYRMVLDGLAFGRGKKLLDLGCGMGIFLSFAAGRYGYQTTGVDFNSQTIDICRAMNPAAEVYGMSFADFFRLPTHHRYDVITFFEVLEHLSEPLEFLQQLRDFLLPAGYIGLSVPNQDNFYRVRLQNDYPPYHLTRWNKESLRYVLNIAGYKVIRIWSPPRLQDILGGYLGLGIGSYLLSKAKKIEQNKAREKEILSLFTHLANLRRGLLCAAAFPANILLKFLGAEGISLVALAKKI